MSDLDQLLDAVDQLQDAAIAVLTEGRFPNVETTQRLKDALDHLTSVREGHLEDAECSEGR